MTTETYTHFNTEKAERVCRFISCLKHVDGEWFGVPFSLLPWQRSAVTQFYGTMSDEVSSVRRFQYLYLEIPKKNGKSELAAALALYHLYADGENNGEVYLCAADRDNASIVFRVALGMLNQCPTLKKRSKIRESTRVIVDTVSGSTLRVLSAEAFSKHGYKPSCVIFDELHAQPNRELWDVMTFGSGSARKQPVWIVLTTAGDDPDRNSIGWEVHEKARRIKEYREGKTDDNYDNPIWLPIIYGLGGDAEKTATIDIYDEKLWYECNPSLGHTLKIETLRQEALDAKQSETSERLFRWLRLNQWIAVKTVGWLPLTLYDATEAKDHPDLEGKRCFAGLDLSSTTDLTALVLFFPKQQGLQKNYVIFKPYITDERLAERCKRDHVPFDRWKQKGYVTATEGNCIDFDYVASDIIKASKQYKLAALGCDPYLSRMLTQQLMKKDIIVYEVPQTMPQMSPAMKELERQLREGETEHETNPCARWCFGNVRCATDGNENIKPMKNRSVDRIDVTVAWIIVTAVYLAKGQEDINERILDDDWGF